MDACQDHIVKQQYGPPHAETLYHVLQRIEGHFIRGYGTTEAL